MRCAPAGFVVVIVPSPDAPWGPCHGHIVMGFFEGGNGVLHVNASLKSSRAEGVTGIASPQKRNARTWEAHQSGSVCVQVVPAYAGM